MPRITNHSWSKDDEDLMRQLAACPGMTCKDAYEEAGIPTTYKSFSTRAASRHIRFAYPSRKGQGLGVPNPGKASPTYQIKDPNVTQPLNKVAKQRGFQSGQHLATLILRKVITGDLIDAVLDGDKE